MRSYDIKTLEEAYALVPDAEDRTPIDARAILSNDKNIMLLDGEDVGLLVQYYPGVYTGHWMFKSRGRGAIDAANRLIAEAFENYPVEVIRGLTPVQLKGALWLARRLGFTSQGVLEFPDGDVCELFCLTKTDFKGK